MSLSIVASNIMHVPAMLLVQNMLQYGRWSSKSSQPDAECWVLLTTTKRSGDGSRCSRNSPSTSFLIELG